MNNEKLTMINIALYVNGLIINIKNDIIENIIHPNNIH